MRKRQKDKANASTERHTHTKSITCSPQQGHPYNTGSSRMGHPTLEAWDQHRTQMISTLLIKNSYSTSGGIARPHVHVKARRGRWSHNSKKSKARQGTMPPSLFYRHLGRKNGVALCGCNIRTIRPMAVTMAHEKEAKSRSTNR